MYQGHLADGSGIQKHSAGGLYPYVIGARQTPDGLQYGLIGAELSDYLWLGSHQQAERAAEQRIAERARIQRTDTEYRRFEDQLNHRDIVQRDFASVLDRLTR